MPINVFFACPRCEITYSAAQQLLQKPYPFGEAYNCKQCGSVVLSWSGEYDFVNWEIWNPRLSVSSVRKKTRKKKKPLLSRGIRLRVADRPLKGHR